MSHARLGPSNPRWVFCPGSIKAEEPYPDISGAAAIDGTGSHLLLEMCLNNNVRAEAYDGQIIGVNHEDNLGGWLINPDRIARVQICLDYVSRRVMELGVQFPEADIVVKAESRSDPGARYGRDDWWGTCDITFVVFREEVCIFLEVCDYKDGRGYVSEKGNTQLIAYLGGKIHELSEPASSFLCRMTIVQPKTNTPIRYVDASSGEVIRKLDELNVAASKTDEEGAPLNSGKHCTWCKHKAACTEESEESLRRIMPMTNSTQSNGSLFETISQTFGDVTLMGSTALAELADARAGIEAVFDKVEAEIQARIEVDPAAVAGYAMMPGRSSKAWNADEDDIVKALKGRRLKLADIYPPKLISPAQMLKCDKLSQDQRDKLQAKFIEIKPGKLTLKKVAHEPTTDATELFADVIETPNATPSWL